MIEVALMVKLVDMAIQLVTVISNSVESRQAVGELIGRRIAEGRTEWTPDDLAEVEQMVQDQKAYAARQLGITSVRLDPAKERSDRHK